MSPAGPRAGAGLLVGRLTSVTAGCGAVIVQGLAATCWWLRLFPRLELACRWTGLRPRGFWGWSPPIGGWNWAPASLAAEPWVSWVYCLCTVGGSGSWAFWWTGPCLRAAVGSEDVKVACYQYYFLSST